MVVRKKEISIVVQFHAINRQYTAQEDTARSRLNVPLDRTGEWSRHIDPGGHVFSEGTWIALAKNRPIVSVCRGSFN